MTFTPENIFFLGAVLIFASIVISKWGYRFGVPTLLLFLFTDMLFGSDGLGLEFHSHEDVQLIGMLTKKTNPYPLQLGLSVRARRLFSDLAKNTRWMSGFNSAIMRKQEEESRWQNVTN